MKSGKDLNSWGAHVDKLEELSSGIAFEDHQVNTDNVDNFNWSPNVTFYL